MEAGDDRAVEAENPGVPAPRRSAETESRLEQIRRRAREAYERASRARERGLQISRRLDELSAGMPTTSRPTAGIVLAAAEASRESTHAADRARRLALDGFAQAARIHELAAHNHDKVADVLERRAVTAPGEEREDLMQRADEHRAKAARHRREATVDREAAENLRRDEPEDHESADGPDRPQP